MSLYSVAYHKRLRNVALTVKVVTVWDGSLLSLLLLNTTDVQRVTLSFNIPNPSSVRNNITDGD